MDEEVNIFQSVGILIDGNNMEMSLHSLVNDTNAMLDMDKVIPRLFKTEGSLA